MDFVATRTGETTTVVHADRWTISHTVGQRLAGIADTEGQLIDLVQVEDWPAEGGPSGAVGSATATVDSLSAALIEYVQTHST